MTGTTWDCFNFYCTTISKLIWDYFNFCSPTKTNISIPRGTVGLQNPLEIKNVSIYTVPLTPSRVKRFNWCSFMVGQAGILRDRISSRSVPA